MTPRLRHGRTFLCIQMALLFPRVSLLSLERYSSLLGPRRMAEASAFIAELRSHLRGRTVWNVSSSHVGGGVAEMVRSLLAYARGAGLDARWVVIRGSAEFFKVTKRLHNAIHGSPGDGSPLGEEQRRIYEAAGRECVAQLAPRVRPGDIVLVHDPQPAAMIAGLGARGAQVVWRCHIGSDASNEDSELGWDFLLPYVRDAGAFVFSRAAYVPARLDASRVAIIPPSIDPFSAKNQALPDGSVRAILVRAGILAGPEGAGSATFAREDGTPGRIERCAEVLRQGPPPSFDVPLAVQVSRWDRLKDPVGVLRGFASHGGAAVRGAQLMLVGPSTRSVADDPEDGGVYREVVRAWRELPEKERLRAHLVALPTADVDENAAIVNAIQRHASVVIQKSLQEGFGLTVSEAMWKSRPVVASRVGGIQDQVDDGEQGLLLDDPRDLRAFGDALERVLADPELASGLGRRGHARVLERYLGIHSILRYGDLVRALDLRRPSSGPEAA